MFNSLVLTWKRNFDVTFGISSVFQLSVLESYLHPWHQNTVPRHADIRVLVYADPDPVIIFKRFVLNHCGVGASLSECGKEFHRWQPRFKKDRSPATRFMWDGNKPFWACRVWWLWIC